MVHLLTNSPITVRRISRICKFSPGTPSADKLSRLLERSGTGLHSCVSPIQVLLPMPSSRSTARAISAHAPSPNRRPRKACRFAVTRHGHTTRCYHYRATRLAAPWRGRHARLEPGYRRLADRSRHARRKPRSRCDGCNPISKLFEHGVALGQSPGCDVWLQSSRKKHRNAAQIPARRYSAPDFLRV
jgi:hypothetical protein